jgi:hypothetical protein
LDDDELFEESPLLGAAPARKIDWLIVGVNFARQVSEAVAEVISNAEMLLCSHANHQVQQAEFQDEARRQIETIIEGE